MNIIKLFKKLFSPLTKEELELLEKVKDYKVNSNVCSYYREYIKNNENEEYETIKSKLIRNIVLGRKGEVIDNRGISYYGNLQIIYNEKEKSIVYLKNCKGDYKFNVDHNKKEWLEKKLGLKEDKIHSFVNNIRNKINKCIA